MIKNIFPTYIWESTYPGYNKEETTRFFDECMQEQGSNQNNYFLINTDTTSLATQETDVMISPTDYPFTSNIMENLNLPDIFKWLNTQIIQYHEYCGYTISQSSDSYIYNLWLNSSSQNGQVLLHNHNPALTSGVFYVDAIPESGNLFLLNPNDLLHGRNGYVQDHSAIGAHGFYPNKWYEFQAESGRLILFPGYLYHQVPKNPTEYKRRVINFDVRILI